MNMLMTRLLIVCLVVNLGQSIDSNTLTSCLKQTNIAGLNLKELLPNIDSKGYQRSRRADTELICRAIFERNKNITAEINSRRTDITKLNSLYAKLIDSIAVKKEGCYGLIEGIGNPVAHRSNKWQAFGTWSKDTAKKDEDIWVSEGLTFNIIKEYVSLNDFKTNNHFYPHNLPFSCDGTGMVVYDGNVYCNKAQTRRMIKYNLKTEKLLVERELANAGFRDTYPYQYGGYSDIDFAVDKSGLWVLYSTSSNQGKIVISKLNVADLSIKKTWYTNYPKQNAGNAFIACGVMYVTNAFNQSPSYISYIYNTLNEQESLLGSGDITFDNTDVEAYSEMISLKYNHNENVLYGWSFYKQYTYDLFRRL